MGEQRYGWIVRRAARRTNLGLLVVLVGAFLSGWVAFTGGSPAAVTTAVHGLFGVAVVALLPWKSMVIRRAAGLRLASLALLVLVVGCLLAGFVQVFAGYVLVLGVTPIQVHVGAAVVAVPLLGWHLLRHRRQRPRRTDLSRRALVQDGVLAAAVGLGYASVAAAAVLVGPDRPRSTSGSRPVDAAPATIWLFDRTPELDPETHLVRVAGAPLTVADLAARAEPVRARLDCTNGWYVDGVWDGVPLSTLIAAERLATAGTLRIRSVTGYERSFPASEAAGLWLAVRNDGRPLDPGRGAPVRLVAPGRRGFWWVKWVGSVDLSDRPSWSQSPFPLQ